MTSSVVPGPEDVLKFWYGEKDTDSYMQNRRFWFQSTPEFDARIREQFAATVESALAGGLTDWEHSTVGLQAKILALDQFTRNMFRGTPKAFAGDAEALRCAVKCIDEGRFEAIPHEQHLFVLLPFMHSEDLAMQKRGETVEFPKLAGYHDAAGGASSVRPEVIKHREMIERFGRFPHRNAALGRESTPEEVAYLAESSHHYGQAVTASASASGGSGVSATASTAASATTTTA